MQRFLTFILALTLASCASNPDKLSVLENDVFVAMNSIESDFTKNSVIIAYDPECPICRLYKTSVDSLSKKYTDVDWKIIVSSGADTALAKTKFYKDSKITIYYDWNNNFLKSLGTTTTPQSFLFNENNELIYSGKLDNRAKALGVKNLYVDSFYLAEALFALENNTKPAIQKTEPIGCLIQ